MRIAMFTHNLAQNGMGRAYCLWLLARELDWKVDLVAPESGEVWPPLADEDEFLATITLDALAAAEHADLLLSLKPWPGAFDRALDAAQAVHKPVAVDVDDPDWESAYGWNLPRMVAGFVSRGLRGQPEMSSYRLRWRAARTPVVLVSNPALRRWYHGAFVVPHVRAVRPSGAPHDRSTEVEVAFVGSVRPHKGVEILREAVERTGDMHLTITGDAPESAKPHETWTGVTSFEEGLDLVDHADIVALPSLPWMYSYQLPVKLIDAMLAGRAIVASDLPPMRWALADAGVLIEPGNVDSLTDALKKLRDPTRRKRLGEAARLRALKAFTPASVAASFAAALTNLF